MENLKDILAHQYADFYRHGYSVIRRAVCNPIARKMQDGGYDVLFEVRAATISHQPGDVLFARRYGGRRRDPAGSGIA